MEQLKTLVLFSGLIFVLNIQPSIGMFDATLRSVEMIVKNDTSFLDASGLKVRKVNRTQHFVSGK